MQQNKRFTVLLRIFALSLIWAGALATNASEKSEEKVCANPNDGFDTVFVDCSKTENKKCEVLQDLRAHGKSSYACYCQNIVENKKYSAECPSYIQSTVTKMVQNSKIIDAKNNRMPASVPVEVTDIPANEK